MIHYVTGDATRPLRRPALIVHCCNDIGAWGAGFTRSLDERFPMAGMSYRGRMRQRNLVIGDVDFVKCSSTITVANVIGQRGIRSKSNPTPLDLWALEAGLIRVAAHAEVMGAMLHMPRIGCGLAGGDWAAVEVIIQRTCGGLDVYVYDLPKGTP